MASARSPEGSYDGQLDFEARLRELNRTITAAKAELVGGPHTLAHGAVLTSYRGPQGRHVMVLCRSDGVITHYTEGGRKWADLHRDLTAPISSQSASDLAGGESDRDRLFAFVRAIAMNADLPAALRLEAESLAGSCKQAPGA